jgi:hypothetical protein
MSTRNAHADDDGFDPDDFVDGIDNPFMPIEPGSIWIYRGEDSLDIVVATGRTKEILGVETTVVRDVAFIDGQLAEFTLDWFAQDDDGNVWYFGEATAEIEDGDIVSREGSWKAGVDGAEPGIVMLAHPKVGETYAQENAPGVAEDHATIIGVDASVDVPFGSFDGVLQTHEFTPLDPDSQETKYYARGIGHVETVDEVSGEVEQLVFFRDGGGGDDCHDDRMGPLLSHSEIGAADWLVA